MAVIDSYSESNQNASTSVATGASGTAFAQCFTGDGEKIVAARFYISKSSLPTGNCIARIYAMTGTFGVNGTVGTLLGTSDNVNVSGITSPVLQTFTFTGAQQYATTAGTHYVASFEFTGGDAANYMNVYYDSTGTHPGTWTFRNDSGVWTPTDAGLDFCFYVDGVAVAVDVTVNLTGVSATPAVGAGIVTIGSAAVTPPEPVLVAGGRRLYWLEDETVQLEGVAAVPEVGRIEPVGMVTRDELFRRFPFPRRQVAEEVQMPHGMRRLFKPVEKPIPPAIFVYAAPFPRLRSAVGDGNVTAHYEDIDEELMALLGVL